jgi:hypothetical protein
MNDHDAFDPLLSFGNSPSPILTTQKANKRLLTGSYGSTSRPDIGVKMSVAPGGIPGGIRGCFHLLRVVVGESRLYLIVLIGKWKGVR